MQKTLIHIDINTKSLVSSSGAFITSVSDYPVIERGQWQILCVQFVNRMVDYSGIVTMPNAALSASSFVFMADNDFDDSTSLMLKSLSASVAFDENDATTNRINVPGDWIDGTTADLSKGQMSIRMNTDTVKFAEVLASTYQMQYGFYATIKQWEGLTNPSTIALFPFVAVNTIKDTTNPEEAVPDGTQLATYVSSALANPLEFQFSVDGVSNWHSTQANSDRYYRQRISNISADWSSAVAFVSSTGGGSVGSTDAADIIISAEAEFYAGMDVASALQTIGATLDGLEVLMTTAVETVEGI